MSRLTKLWLAAFTAGGEPTAPLRIGINAQKLSTHQSYHAAGASRYVFHLLRELRALGAPEEFVAYLSQRHVPDELRATPTFRVRPTRWSTESPPARILWEQTVLPLDLHHDRVTLFHGPVNALPIGWLGPSVVTILDLTFFRTPGAFNRSNRLYQWWMARFAARRADRIIAISEATRQDVIRTLGADPSRVIRVYCGVDERFRPMDDARTLAEFRCEHGLPERFILYVGTIEPRKNLIRLIDAYTELRRDRVTDWPLVLAGGRGWQDEAIFRRATQTSVAEDIRFVGYVPDQELPLWYNAAALFVYPSEYEGFGLPVLEALACGTPVVSSNRSSLPEVTGDSAVLVDPSSVQAIRAGLTCVLEDRSLRARLATEGPRRAARFSWRRMAKETLAVYRAVSNAP